MTSQNTSRLPQVIRRYGEVAEAVNHREMRRSVEEIAHRWKPPPHEEEYRCEGWTHEGAFTKTIYQEALNLFGGSGRCHSPGATEAEVHEQIQISPSLEGLMDFVSEPLIEPPLSADRRKVLLENIKAGLKQQASSLGVDATNLELPEDLDVLYSTVMGINAAGVPAETNFTQLVYAHDERSRAPDEMPYEMFIRRDGHLGLPDLICALKVGGCEQHRSIYYVLTVPKRTTDIPAEAKWKIWDLREVEHEEYDSLTEFLEHETRHVEESRGGARLMWVVIYDRYPG